MAGNGGDLASGELVLLLDPDGKRFLVRLAEQDALRHHRGAVRHADVIGQPDGALVRSSQGRLFVAVRPRLIDSIFEMPRHSGIVYPKDAAHLLAWADIAPAIGCSKRVWARVRSHWCFSARLAIEAR